MKLFGILGLLLLPNLSLVECACHDPSPAFPPPKFDSPTPELDLAFSKITSSINQITNSDDYSTTSLSLEVTSSQRTLFTHYHTASVRNLTRPGAFTVNGSSAYRIASCTKVFTVLGILQQHVKGTLHLDDPVSKYLPELTKKQTGTLPWKDITLRALGSQLSGIPGDVIQGDLITDPANPEDFGLPPKSKEGLPTCGGFSPVRRPCTEKDLIEALRKQKPTFAPAQHSSYCNVGFEILGLVLAKASKMEYSTYIHSMLEELGIEGITFDKPGDDLAVLPAGEAWYWDVELGVHRPTGGLYSGSAPLSAFLRYILTHYNGITTAALNWLHPVSYSHGMNSFYGMPWEIFRSNKVIKNAARPTTFVTKSGGHPAYTSIMILVPDYDLGITILVAGNGKLLDEVREVVTQELIPAVELLAQRQLGQKYAGTYAASEKAKLDSRLELSHSITSGLYISELISNGTNVLKVLLPHLARDETFDLANWRLQLMPTLLFADPEKQKGELWRALLVPQKRTEAIWDDFCVNQIDTVRYAGKPLTELVFWTNDDDTVTEVSLSAFDVTMRKQGQSSLSVQGLSIDDEVPVLLEL